MKKPSVPANEAERLAALKAYDILDTAPEAAFDALTELAAGILEVPIALVSIIDRDRQWFKSRHGVDVSETSRDISFCGHVVAESSPLIVRDALEDSRFADNPLTTGGPRIRFYVGMPLRLPGGFTFGTLCAIGHAPKAPTPHQLRMLALLADQVVVLLEARRREQQLAAALETSAEDARRLEVLFAAMAEGVVVQDREGTITGANNAAEQILGMSVDQMAGRSSLDLRWRAVHEDGSPFPGTDHPAMVVLRTGQARRNVLMGVHKPGGELTWISINCLPLEDERTHAARGTICTFHDVTRLKEAGAAAERLSRREHLVTIGTLAAGVGHEINNPLAFILANIDYALEQLRAIAGGSPSGRLRELIGILEEAREGNERIRKIVRGLRAFSREESAPMPTDVANAVEISINMAAHELRQKASISTALAATPLVLTDESRLSQVLVNLIVNAAQAFPSSDTDRNRITVTSQIEPDGRVRISVGDNGPGVPAALQRRIFDPFFTTKPPGEGTGLGLSISQSIILALGGELTLSSEEGAGATFSVLLPVADAPLAEPLPKPTLEAAARGRVLVVDDEEAVGRAIARVLSPEHEVVTLGDPREALRRFQAGERFDVVFCDIMMPHLGGDALYEKVKELDRDQAERFVFTTGGSGFGRTASFLGAVANERIEKPFSSQNLRGIARRFARTPVGHR